ncbi:MAG: 2-oxo acid dehydrogenase subunit E2 [Acutalibacteraceae bacterium]|jgi:pyruvate dehydrogenase E2 component (dihydrolipoamide acetyltransferase)
MEKTNGNKQVTFVGKKAIRKGLHIRQERFKIVRKIVAHMTSESWQNIPHCTSLYEPDVTDFINEFKALRENLPADKKLTLNTLMLKVVVEGLKAAPHLNAFLEYNKINARGALDIVEEINISMPLKIDDENTITVNVQKVNDLTLSQIGEKVLEIKNKALNTNLDELYFQVAFRQSMDDLRELKVIPVLRRLYVSRVGKDKVHPLSGKAKKEYYRIPESQRLTIEDVQQGTLVVTNIGSVTPNSPVSTPLLEIIPPQVIAVAIGPAIEKPGVVAEDGEKIIKPRLFMPICIAFDHRAFDYSAVAPFIKKLDEIFANPEIIREW